MDWKALMHMFTNTKEQSEIPAMEIANIEGQEALRALDEVGCVEVSQEVARELGAFDEQAISLDDVLDDEA